MKGLWSLGGHKCRMWWCLWSVADGFASINPCSLLVEGLPGVRNERGMYLCSRSEDITVGVLVPVKGSGRSEVLGAVVVVVASVVSPPPSLP